MCVSVSCQAVTNLYYCVENNTFWEGAEQIPFLPMDAMLCLRGEHLVLYTVYIYLS